MNLKVVVGAVIGNKKKNPDKFLIIKRGNKPYKDMWSIPGGKVNFGEHMIDALKREIKEETGLEIEVVKHICTFDEILKDQKEKLTHHFVFVSYFGYPIAGEAKASSDAVDLKWMSIDEIKRLYRKGLIPEASLVPFKYLRLID